MAQTPRWPGLPPPAASTASHLQPQLGILVERLRAVAATPSSASSGCGSGPAGVGAKGKGLREDLSAGMLWAEVSREGSQWEVSGRRPSGRIWGYFSGAGGAGGGARCPGGAGPLWGLWWPRRGEALVGAPRRGRASRRCPASQFMQKKSPLYLLLKDDTVWSMEHLNRYINDKFREAKRLPRDWVFTTFTVRARPAHPALGGARGQDRRARGLGALGPRHVRPWAGLPLGVRAAVGSRDPLLSLFLKQIVHTTQKSLCESTVQWFLVDSQSCRVITTL